MFFTVPIAEIEVSSTSDQSSADVISVSSGKSSQQSQTSRRSQHAQDPEAEFDLMFSPTPKASAGGGTRSGGDGRPNSVVAGGEVKVKSDMVSFVLQYKRNLCVPF